MLEAPVKMQQQLESKWLPPDEPSYKINVDGAVFASKKEVGVGVVIRDHKGILLLGFVKSFKFRWGLLRLKQRLLKLECFLQLIWVFRTLSWKETLSIWFGLCKITLLLLPLLLI